MLDSHDNTSTSITETDLNDQTPNNSLYICLVQLVDSFVIFMVGRTTNATNLNWQIGIVL